MGLFDAFVLVGLLFVGIPLAGVLGWVLRRVFRVRRFTWVPLVLVLATIVAGAPIALRVAGVQTDARVVARDERVTVDARDGSWVTRPTLRVRYRPTDARRADPLARSFSRDSVDAAVSVNADEFDRTPVDAVVPVTYVGFRPSIAKLTDRTFADFWREALGIGAASARHRSATHVVVDPLPAAAIARVEAIATISSCDRCVFTTNSERLAQPFQVVTLAFTPPGARFPVRTADAVDSGSVRGLADDARIAVHYAPDRPRELRIDGAARTFGRRNGRDTILLTIAFWAVVALLYVAWSYAWPRVRARMS